MRVRQLRRLRSVLAASLVSALLALANAAIVLAGGSGPPYPK